MPRKVIAEGKITWLRSKRIVAGELAGEERGLAGPVVSFLNPGPSIEKNVI